MSPLNSKWFSATAPQEMWGNAINRGRCRDLVAKMIEGGVSFTVADKPIYHWLLGNMHRFLTGTIYAQYIPGFRMTLTNAWEGGEKVFFDLELLHKLDVALDVFLTTAPADVHLTTQLNAGFYSRPRGLGATFMVDRRGRGT